MNRAAFVEGNVNIQVPLQGLAKAIGKHALRLISAPKQDLTLRSSVNPTTDR
jgi:hypothetical protein